MFINLLFIFFMSFWAMGFHQSVLGAVWPSIHSEFGVAISFLSYISLIRGIGKVVGSFLCQKLIKRLGSFKTCILGFSLICIAIFGYSFSSSILILCLSVIPIGLGESIFDCSLNAYAAVHFKSKHINWMNMFWSLSNAIGPYIMTFCLVRGSSWRLGYLVIFAIQFVMFIVFLTSYPQWEHTPAPAPTPEHKKTNSTEPLPLKKLYLMMGFLFCYVAVENASGLWISSYISLDKGLSEDIAILGTTFLFAGMTLGRFLSGFLSERLNDRQMLYFGEIMILLGSVTLIFSPEKHTILLSCMLLGFGCAPIHPCFIHYIPEVFGTENTVRVVSLIMASSQIAALTIPTIFGWVAGYLGMWLYPYLHLVLASLMILLLTYLNKHIVSK